MRSNEELERMYDHLKILGVLKAQRLIWLAHIQRMVETRLLKRILAITIEGKKRRRRPKMRWKKDVKRDVKELKIINSKVKATNKK